MVLYEGTMWGMQVYGQGTFNHTDARAEIFKSVIFEDTFESATITVPFGGSKVDWNIGIADTADAINNQGVCVATLHGPRTITFSADGNYITMHRCDSHDNDALPYRVHIVGDMGREAVEA